MTSGFLLIARVLHALGRLSGLCAMLIASQVAVFPDGVPASLISTDWGVVDFPDSVI
jgi:hypothetical protein